MYTMVLVAHRINDGNAQAWSLAWTEKPLFDENFEEWANEPVWQEMVCLKVLNVVLLLRK